MRLEFERTVDDYVTFVQTHMRRSRQYKWRRLVLALAGGIAIGAVNISSGPLVMLLAAVTFALVLYAATPWLQSMGLRSAYRKNKKNVGPAEIEVTDDGIVARRGDYELKTRWDSVGKVVTEGDYTFIYIDEASAYIIPHTRIRGGNYVLFMQELARRLEAHTLVPLNAASAGALSPTPALPTVAPSETNPSTVPLQRG